MNFKDLERKFYKHKAEVITGSMKDIADRLNDINQSKDMHLGFISSIVPDGNGFSAIIQIKEEIRPFTRRDD